MDFPHLARDFELISNTISQTSRYTAFGVR